MSWNKDRNVTFGKFFIFLEILGEGNLRVIFEFKLNDSPKIKL